MCVPDTRTLPRLSGLHRLRRPDPRDLRRQPRASLHQPGPRGDRAARAHRAAFHRRGARRRARVPARPRAAGRGRRLGRPALQRPLRRAPGRAGARASGREPHRAAVQRPRRGAAARAACAPGRGLRPRPGGTPRREVRARRTAVLRRPRDRRLSGRSRCWRLTGRSLDRGRAPILTVRGLVARGLSRPVSRPLRLLLHGLVRYRRRRRRSPRRHSRRRLRIAGGAACRTSAGLRSPALAAARTTPGCRYRVTRAAPDGRRTLPRIAARTSRAVVVRIARGHPPAAVARASWASAGAHRAGALGRPPSHDLRRPRGQGRRSADPGGTDAARAARSARRLPPSERDATEPAATHGSAPRSAKLQAPPAPRTAAVSFKVEGSRRIHG